MTNSKKHKIIERKNELGSICGKYGVNCIEFYINSFRLKKYGFITIDYYPKTNKCFFHDIREWGLVENIEQFIKYQFLP